MPDKIRVLIADDDPIYREGLRATLRDVECIKVVGEAVVAPECLPLAQDLGADVVILDLKWGGDKRAGFAILTHLKDQLPKVSVAAVSAIDELLAEARQYGADWVSQKNFDRQDLLAAIPALAKGVSLSSGIPNLLAKAKSLTEKLEGITIGHADALRYQHLIGEVASFLFSPSLSDFDEEPIKRNSKTRADIRAMNHGQNSFWQYVLDHYRASHVMIECKNVSVLKNDHVNQLNAYLGRHVGHFGLLITRNPPSQTRLEHAYDILQRSDNLMLVLSDQDVVNMLNMKGDG